MIQFNLLPDVKLEYLKAQRTKRLVVSVSVLAGAAALALLLILLVVVDGLQKKNIHDLSADITSSSAKLRATPNLSKILTVQNQLGALTKLHDQKPSATRLFDFLGQMTPANVTISKLDADFTQNTLSISGAAPSLDEVNTFTDTLKFTTYQAGSATGAKAFSSVVLSTFSRNDKDASYTITLAFDPAIFSNATDVQLTVPNIVTTRSTVEQPTDLFKNNPAPSPSGGNR